MNSQDIISFDGVDDVLNGDPTGLPTGGSNRTVFMVARDQNESDNVYKIIFAYGEDHGTYTTFDVSLDHVYL